MKNKILIFVLILAITTNSFMYDVFAQDDTFTPNYSYYLGSDMIDFTTSIVCNSGLVSSKNIVIDGMQYISNSSDTSMHSCYTIALNNKVDAGKYSSNTYECYYINGMNGISFGTSNGVPVIVCTSARVSTTPLFNIIATGDLQSTYNGTLYVSNYAEYTEPEPPILVKIYDVIVNSNAYQSISKLGKWVRDSVTDALTFEPSGSLISVNIGDTITVTDSNNTVTNIPTSYVLPSVTYNGGNTSVNINTNKIVDYMGQDEVTFQSIKYDITYEYIDESENVVNETYTYNYNYNDKEIVYGPQDNPTANNSTDDTTITVNQPQGSQNVENSSGALGSVISSIASIFVGALNGLLGGIATIVGSLTNLITNTGGFFDAIGGVIAPFYQNTILGSIVNILAIGLFATFIIGFFKK